MIFIVLDHLLSPLLLLVRFSVSPSDVSTFILSIQSSIGLPLFLFPSTLACGALCGIRSIGILCKCPNDWNLR